MSNIEYKTGDVDDIGAILSENGTGIDLEGYTVEFVMKHTSGNRVIVPCSLGSTVNGTDILSSAGGVTINFSAESTSVSGVYNAEFVATIGENVIHIPSGSNYISVTIWDAL